MTGRCSEKSKGPSASAGGVAEERAQSIEGIDFGRIVGRPLRLGIERVHEDHRSMIAISLLKRSVAQYTGQLNLAYGHTIAHHFERGLASAFQVQSRSIVKRSAITQRWIRSVFELKLMELPSGFGCGATPKSRRTQCACPKARRR